VPASEGLTMRAPGLDSLIGFSALVLWPALISGLCALVIAVEAGVSILDVIIAAGRLAGAAMIAASIGIGLRFAIYLKSGR